MQMCGKTVCAGGWGEMDRTHMDEVRKLMSLPPPPRAHTCMHAHACAVPGRLRDPTMESKALEIRKEK